MKINDSDSWYVTHSEEWGKLTYINMVSMTVNGSNDEFVLTNNTIDAQAAELQLTKLNNKYCAYAADNKIWQVLSETYSG